MIRAPHPDLRRLFALGGVMSRTAERLGGVLPELSQLASAQIESTLVDDDVLQSLARSPGLEALFGETAERAGSEEMQNRAQTRREALQRPASKAESPGRGSVRPPGARARDVTPAMATAVAGELLTARSSRLMNENVVGSSQRMSRDDAGAQASVGHNRSRILERAAQTGTTAGSMPSAPSPDNAGRARPEIRDAQRAFSTTRFKQSEPTLTRGVVTRDLRRRAERAGAPAAADTPMLIAPTSTQVAILLAQAADSGHASGREANAGSIADDGSRASTRGPVIPVVRVPNIRLGADTTRAADAALSVPVLERVLERIPAQTVNRKRNAEASPRAASARSVAGLWTNPVVRDRNPSPFADSAPEEPTSGLRRLLARHDSVQHSASSAGLKRELPHTPLSGVVANRLKDAELADALDRLLRREARRQGVDLEGLS